MNLDEIGCNLAGYEAYSKNHIMVTADRLCRKYGKEDDDSIWAAQWNRCGLSIKQIRWLMNEHVHGNLTYPGRQMSVYQHWTMRGVRRLIESGEKKLQAREIPISTVCPCCGQKMLARKKLKA